MFISEHGTLKIYNILDLLTVYSIVMILCTNFIVVESMDNCEIITEVVLLVLYSIK